MLLLRRAYPLSRLFVKVNLLSSPAVSSVGGGLFNPICSRFNIKLNHFVTANMSMKVCIIGSGNWGSTIAKVIGSNTPKYDTFANEIKMYVFEEMIDGRKLTEIINSEHENVKYLSGHKLPSNVVAVPDLLETAKDADILVFVLPHQFIRKTCETLLGKIKPTAVGISLIKGFDLAEGGGIALISHIIRDTLKIPMSVLMGANLAPEVADEKFCETTIGCSDAKIGFMYRNLIQTSYFRVVVVDDVEAVEVCGALKNIVACGAGFVDGLGYGDNTKAAVIRLGLMEMIKFCEVFYSGSKLGTFFESCGVADLITTCYGGRNRKVSEAFVKTGKTIEQLEEEMLNGQKLQGPYTAAEINFMLKRDNMEDRFPLFTAVHRICKGDFPPSQMIECIRNHPEHLCIADRNFCNIASHTPDSKQLIQMVWKCAPVLSGDMHKGQNGRIGVVGGSLEYTGAPYFTAMSAMRVGADGTHIFCMKDAAIPIKSYSPELIVHPILDSEDPVNDLLEWIPRLHALVVGPGLGRKPQIFSTLGHVFQMAKDRQLPLVIDADALYYLNDNYDVIEGYDKAVLTPNIMEMARLYRSTICEDVQPSQITWRHVSKVAKKLGVTIVCKGAVDIICSKNESLVCDTEGTLKRCNGQGDVLGGAMAVILYWVLSRGEFNSNISNTALAAWGACDITRRAAAIAYRKHSRSMITTDILNVVGSVSAGMPDFGLV